MRLYMGESLDGVSVSEGDDPTQGGMIARNPNDHTDKWFVALKYFMDNYEPAK